MIAAKNELVEKNIILTEVFPGIQAKMNLQTVIDIQNAELKMVASDLVATFVKTA